MKLIKHLAAFAVMMLLPISIIAQTRGITGKVSDGTGAPLRGVIVYVQGSTENTMTGDDGSYSINARQDQTLVFSLIGYTDATAVVGERNVINVTLQTDKDFFLDETVVVGYGTQSKRTVTSAISRIGGETLKNVPINTVGEGLKGKVAGLRVYNANNTPGSEASFIIRGGSSISQGSDPLVLVDGVERSLAGINPNDIESIEVLKDAASSAIYGSRASNGVVLITTRKGSVSAPKVTFETSVANENVERMIKYLNAAETVALARDRLATVAYSNQLTADGNAFSSGNSETSKFSTRYLNPGEAVPEGWSSCPDPLDPSKTLVFEDNDWAKESFRSAWWRNYYVGVEGGTERTNYVSSIGYLKDSGVGVGTGYDRFNARMNATTKLRDNLIFTGGLDYSQTNSSEYANQYQAITRGLMTPPTQRRYWAAGTWEGTPTPGPNASSPNPLFYSYFNTNETKYNRTGLNGSIEWEILKGWKVVGTGSLFLSSREQDSFHKADPLNGTRTATSYLTSEQRKKLEIYTSYTNTFAQKHYLSAMVGYSYQNYNYKYLQAASQGHSSDKITTLNGGPTPSVATSTKNLDVNIGFFGRLNYDYMKKYMLTLTFREDGSSRFVEGYRWGFFPGLSAGWIMSDEPFMDNLRFISNLKWRVSYGQTGNNSVGYYDALGLFAVTTPYESQVALYSSEMANQALAWETSTQLDLGFDLGLANNRIILGFDYFNKITDNLITSKTLPNTSGYSAVLTNNGTVRFRGFDLDITTRNINKRDFSWETKFTLSYVKNLVLKLPENGREKNRQGGYTVTMKDGSNYEFGGTAEGEPLGRIYGYMTDYIITTKEQAENAHYDNSSKGWDWTTKTSMGKGKKTIGDYEWKDLNGDDIINGKDMFLLGNTIPTTTGGLNNTVTFKNFTFNVYLDYALGHSISNGYLQRQMCNFMGGNTSLPREILKCWNVGDDPTTAKYARYSGNDSDNLNKNFRDNSNVFVQKADFLCLREVSLAYSLPSKILQKSKIDGVTFTLAGNNLHYFTDVIGISPELGASSTYSASFYTYPPIRKISLSCRIIF